MAYARSTADDAFKLRGLGVGHQLHERGGRHCNAGFLHAAKLALSEHGPIPFGIAVEWAFMAYAGGVYTMDCGDDANHAVLMIGYGEDYVLGMNSWGHDWGINGAFKISPCGVHDYTIPGDFDMPGVSSIEDFVSNIADEGEFLNSTYPFPLPDLVPNPGLEVASGAGDMPKKIKDGTPCRPDPITGCVTTPNFPEEYSLGMSCSIPKDLGRGKPVRLLVEEFDTEVGYDVLQINGRAYSGLDGPHGLEPEGDLLWVSDADVAGKGWKICPEEV